MIYSRYSDEETVRAFKAFMKVTVKNLSIDFFRKIERKEQKNVYFSEFVERKVSLSKYDNGTFFGIDAISNDIQGKIIKKISRRDKEILIEFYINNLSIKEIAENFNTTENSIKASKSRCIKKIKQYLEVKDV